MYFESEQFRLLKNSIASLINDCNDLNRHIENLKDSYVNIKAYDYGHRDISDTSRYNFQRSEWKHFIKSHRVHNCSASVLNNVRNQPIKYLCKYFDIKVNEESLINIESVLNSFSAAEQGKWLLANERDMIIDGIYDVVPGLIYLLAKNRLTRYLGFKRIDLSDIYFPVYTFQYISSGGNSSAKCEIKLNIQNLEILIEYLGDLVKFHNSIQGQRALMTTKLREYIKMRDDYECQICGISVDEEPNILLEIDHIIPLSKGGFTCEENLQTLCWKCNRTKGAKIYSNYNSDNE